MYEQIRRNRRASWLLMGLVVALLAVLGYVIGFATIGGTSGGLGLLGVFGVVAIVWSIVGYYAGDKMVLAVSGAHRVTHDEEPQLFNVVEEMTIAAGLPQAPAVFVLEDADAQRSSRPGATHARLHRGHSRADGTPRPGGTAGRRRSRDVAHPQLRHPLRDARRHPRRHDRPHRRLLPALELLGRHGPSAGRRSSGRGPIFAVIAIVLAIVAPAAAYAVQFAVSRRREYLADATAVELTRNPLGLAKALNKIAADPRPLRHANRATAHLYIANPLKKAKDVTGVFDTHPPIRQRIAVLLAMAHVGPEALAGGDTSAPAAPPAPQGPPPPS